MRNAGIGHDLKLAVRALRSRPGFTLVAVLSLAVAIGANATIFGLVDAVLFRPLPGNRPAPLVSVFTGARHLVWGLSIGLALSLAAGLALRGMLYGLSPLDLPAYATVLLGLAASALFACWLPARRAAAVNPVIALRHE